MTSNYNYNSSCKLVRYNTTSSIDTNATAPNLPGPGRTVGLLFDWLGAKFENALRIGLLKLGHDPDAVSQEIRKLCHHHKKQIDSLHKFPGQGLTSVDKKHLKKLCKKPADCTRFVILFSLKNCFLSNPKIQESDNSTQGFGRDNKPCN